MDQDQGLEVRIRNDELHTVRQAMRELNQLLPRLEQGQLTKLVLTQRNRMRAVVLSAERYAELQQLEDGLRDAA